MARRESPVNIGDLIFIVDPDKFDIIEATVESNPSDHLWVTLNERKKGETNAPRFVGPHRWAETREEAARKAVSMIDDRRRALKSELEALDAQKRFLQK